MLSAMNSNKRLIKESRASNQSGKKHEFSIILENLICDTTIPVIISVKMRNLYVNKLHV